MRKEYFLMILAGVFWGSGHPVVKVILNQPQPHLDSFQIAFLSSFIGFIVLMLVIITTRKVVDLKRLGRAGFTISLIAGVLQYGIYPVLSYTALVFIPASFNALLVGTNPLFIAVLSLIFLRERLSKRGYLGIVVAFLGVAMVLSGGFDLSRVGPINLLGAFFALLGALVAATYALIGRYLMRKQDALAVTTVGNLFGAVFLSMVAGIHSGFVEILQSSLVTVSLMLYWGVVLAVASVLFYFCLKNLQTPRAGVFIFVSPVAATILSVIFLHEVLTVFFLAGMIFIFLGIRLTQL